MLGRLGARRPALSPAVTPQDSGLVGVTLAQKGRETTPLPAPEPRLVGKFPSRLPPPIHSTDPRRAWGGGRARPHPTSGTPGGERVVARSQSLPCPPRPAPTRRNRRRPSPPGAAPAAAAAPPTPSCSAPAGRSRRADPTCPPAPPAAPEREPNARRAVRGAGLRGGSRRQGGFLPLRGTAKRKPALLPSPWGGPGEDGPPQGGGGGQGPTYNPSRLYLLGSTHLSKYPPAFQAATASHRARFPAPFQPTPAPAPPFSPPRVLHPVPSCSGATQPPSPARVHAFPPHTHLLPGPAPPPPAASSKMKYNTQNQKSQGEPWETFLINIENTA